MSGIRLPRGFGTMPDPRGVPREAAPDAVELLAQMAADIRRLVERNAQPPLHIVQAINLAAGETVVVRSLNNPVNTVGVLCSAGVLDMWYGNVQGNPPPQPHERFPSGTSMQIALPPNSWEITFQAAGGAAATGTAKLSFT